MKIARHQGHGYIAVGLVTVSVFGTTACHDSNAYYDKHGLCNRVASCIHPSDRVIAISVHCRRCQTFTRVTFAVLLAYRSHLLHNELMLPTIVACTYGSEFIQFKVYTVLHSTARVMQLLVYGTVYNCTYSIYYMIFTFYKHLLAV